MSRKGTGTGRGHKPKGGGGERSHSSDVESLDVYLQEKHLKRKPTAKDGSCLFRAVAEQVYLTQFYHQRVRKQCVDYIRAHQKDFQNFVSIPFKEYLGQLSQELWGGEMELVVISKLYARNVVVYMCNEQSGKISEKPFGELTGNNNPIRLAYFDGNHYDSVYSTQHFGNMAMCQGILYTLLFEGVLKHKIPPFCINRLDTLNSEDLALTSKKYDMDLEKPLRLLFTHYNPDCLRAMASQMYHNAPLTIYKNDRETIERFDHEVASSIQFQIGDQCRFRLPDSKVQEGEICALNSSEHCHTVFVFSANEEWAIPIKDISLKHPYTANAKRNFQQNRFRNRHGNTYTEDAYNRHDNHPPSKPFPPSSNPEAWPPPSSISNRTQTTKSPVVDSRAVPVEVAKSTVSSQTTSVDKSKPWPQKVPGSSQSKQGTTVPPKGVPPQTHTPKTVPPLSKNPNTAQHNTGSTISKVPSTTLRKPPGLSKPANQQASARPTKVNGGPAGSLTSEESYSGASSSDESTGQSNQTEQAAFPTNSPQPPSSQSNSAKQNSGQAHYDGGPPTHAVQRGPVWPAGPESIPGKGRAPSLVPVLNGFPEEQSGRQSPYLTPQLPRDPSSQPEDDWPALNSADSRMLPFMSLRVASPLNIPTEPALMAMTSTSFNQMPMPQFPSFGPFPPGMYFHDVPRGNHEGTPAQGRFSNPFSENRFISGGPVFQEQSTKFPNNSLGNPAPPFVVQRTPSGSVPAHRAQPPGDSPKPVSSPKSPNIPSPQPPFSKSASQQALHKERSPESRKASLVQPKVQLSTSFTQTLPLPEKIDSGTQVELLGVTTYTQTPVKSFVDVGVEARVHTLSKGTQTFKRMKSSEAQTSANITLPGELEPPGLDEESSPDEKIKFAVKYTIQCLELCADKKDSEDERVDKVLESLKEFEENGLSSYLDRLNHPSMVPLNSSQQDFIQSIAASHLQQLSQHSPLAENGFFQRSTSQDSPTDRREMVQNFLRQQEMLRQGGSPMGEGSSTSLPGKEEDVERLPFPPPTLPPHPMSMGSVPPMMMRPPFMFMPFYPFSGYPMPPLPMVPPQMFPQNLMDPQSPHSPILHPPINQESDEREDSTKSAESKPNQDDGLVFGHQESGKVENDSLLETDLVAPSAFTVPPTAYEQPSTVVSSEVKVQTDASPQQNSEQPPRVSGKKRLSESPPSTPFDRKNPYDALPVVNSIPPATDRVPQETKPQETRPQETKPLDAASPGDHRSSVQVDELQNLPNRKVKQSSQRQQRMPQPQRASRQSKYPQNQHSDRQAPQEPQTGTGDPSRNEGKAHKEFPTSRDSSDGSENKSRRPYFKHQYQKAKGVVGGRSGGNQGRQQKQYGSSSASGTSNYSYGQSRSFHRKPQDFSSQGSGSGSQSRRQDTSAQPSGRTGGHGGQDSTRFALHVEHSERSNVPCTAFQPRAFRGGFPSPHHPASSLDGDYARPQPVVNRSSSPRWKFRYSEHKAQPPVKQKPPSEDNRPFVKQKRDLLDWDATENSWPDWHRNEDLRVEGSQTVEDPFPAYSPQHCWDSDAGDLNVSLTVDPLTSLEGDGRFPPPTASSMSRDNAHGGIKTHAQCVSESKVSSKVDSECVVGNN